MRVGRLRQLRLHSGEGSWAGESAASPDWLIGPSSLSLSLSGRLREPWKVPLAVDAQLRRAWLLELCDRRPSFPPCPLATPTLGSRQGTKHTTCTCDSIFCTIPGRHHGGQILVLAHHFLAQVSKSPIHQAAAVLYCDPSRTDVSCKAASWSRSVSRPRCLPAARDSPPGAQREFFV